MIDDNSNIKNDSNRLMILSVIGVLILIIVVVGVTYAFFNYTRVGANNNQITTGTLVFNFEDGNRINLENHFPISTQQGKELTGNNNVCTFSIRGSKNGSTGTLRYTIYAVVGDSELDKTRFDDSEVFINIKKISGGTGATFVGVSKYTGENAAAIDDLTNLKLGDGEITATSPVTMNFEVRMWVDQSVVTIGDVGATYTLEQYATKYYSMKILVEADA